MKKKPDTVELVSRHVDMEGYSFLFPKGSKVFIQKKVTDGESGDIVYHGTYFGPRHCVEMQFHGDSGVHTSFVPNQYDAKGVLIHRPSAYCVKINPSQLA